MRRPSLISKVDMRADDDLAVAVRGDWTFPAVYSLGFLTLISAFNYFDRSLLGLAMPQIKAELQISDTVMGLVSGLAFILFYSIMSVPIAWAADRWNRRNIVAAGLAFWSPDDARDRMGHEHMAVDARTLPDGGGEACGLAPSNAMTADLFRPERRPLAYSIFATATSISSILFFPIAGWVGQNYGWRQMFVVAGIPGIFLAGLFLLTVREPRRGASDRRMNAPATRESEGEKALPFWQGVRFLLGLRAYLALLVGATLMGLNIFASSVWTPTFLTRVHHLSLAEIAATIGPISRSLRPCRRPAGRGADRTPRAARASVAHAHSGLRLSVPGPGRGPVRALGCAAGLAGRFRWPARFCFSSIRARSSPASWRLHRCAAVRLPRRSCCSVQPCSDRLLGRCWWA